MDADAENDRVYDDDLLTQGDVSRAAGVGERSVNTRASSSNRLTIRARATTSPVVALDDEEETEEEDDEGYKSNDSEDEMFFDEDH